MPGLLADQIQGGRQCPTRAAPSRSSSGTCSTSCCPRGIPQERRARPRPALRARVRQGLEAGHDRPAGGDRLPRGRGAAEGRRRRRSSTRYGELVDEGCLAVFGPAITDNAVPTREAIEQRFQVPAISVDRHRGLARRVDVRAAAGLDDRRADLLGAPAGQGRARPRSACLVEQSLIGDSYIRNFRKACARRAASASSPRSGSRRRHRTSATPCRKVHEAAARRARALRVRLRRRVSSTRRSQALGWDPPRFMGTAFQNAWINDADVERDPRVDRTRPVRRSEPGGPDGSSTSSQATYGAAPGVLRAGREPRPRHRVPPRLRRRPSADAARREGSPRAGQDAARRQRRARDPYLSFGKWTRRGWMGAGYLVARQLDAELGSSHLVDRFGQD